jgi:hypothetical protein
MQLRLWYVPVCQRRIDGFLCHSIIQESGMGRRGYPPEFKRKVLNLVLRPGRVRRNRGQVLCGA